MAGFRVDAELQGFKPVELEGDKVQLRFAPIVLPNGASRVVPTLTLSREALIELATKLKLIASDLPTMDEK